MCNICMYDIVVLSCGALQQGAQKEQQGQGKTLLL